MKGQHLRGLMMIGGLTLMPAMVMAQNLSGITGVVRDATGGVLPGVAVEAASAVLIEKVRVVTSDLQGQYRIVDLRPGTYSVTFTMPGFNTVRREGLELTSGFTASVNVDMQLGGVEETLTVTGATPVVDVTNVQTLQLLSREKLDTVPTARSLQGYTALTLGAVTSGSSGSNQDVGGNKAENSSNIAIHGSRPQDMKTLFDGMRLDISAGPGGGTFQYFRVNQLGTQEVMLETAGMNAEAFTGGVQLNVIPKDGGNTFRGVIGGAFTNGALQEDNLTQELRDRGTTSGPEIKAIYDIGGGFGGPIQRDRLWFYVSQRAWGADQYYPAAYFNKTQGTLFYTADLDRQASRPSPAEDYSGRVTWQAATKHKLTLFGMKQRTCACYRTTDSTRAPEASVHIRFRPWLGQGSWTYSATNRLLFQAGVTYANDNRFDERPDETSPYDIPVVLSNGFSYGAFAGIGLTAHGHSFAGYHVSNRFSVSYVTGSHAFKAGILTFNGTQEAYMEGQLPQISYRFLAPTATSALPTTSSVTYYAGPHLQSDGLFEYATFVQDQWTVVQRLTLNLGLRFEHMHSWANAGTRPAGPFMEAFQYERVDNVPNWKDLSPRVGAAYDLFGNGKTAIKASLGRYVIGSGSQIAFTLNPANSISTNTTRTWNDANGDYVPQDSELGPSSNPSFGKQIPVTRYSDEVLSGFSVRPDMWQTSASLQHELRPNVGLTAAYFRTWYSKFTATDNVAVTPSDYDHYCVTVPTDGRLALSGQQICGLYNISRAASTRVADNVVTKASTFGEQTEIYQSVEFQVNARLRGASLAAGVSTALTEFDNCLVVDSPQLQFCRNTLPWRGQTQVKANGSFPLPWWDLQASGLLQVLPGLPMTATRTYLNSEIAPSLGRNLSACPADTGPCTATATVTIMEPNTQFEDRLIQVDTRLSKTLSSGSRRLRLMFDIYNLTNSNTVLRANGAYGSLWLVPSEILPGRLYKFSAQFDF
jgi:hypothetical protein